MDPQKQETTQPSQQEKVSQPLRPGAPPVVSVESETSPAQWVSMVLGVAFILVGLAGFVLPNLLGMHLNASHNIVHLVSGVLSIWFGVGRSNLTAERFCYIFGTIYGMLGLAGFLFGSAVSMIPPMMDYDSYWWRVIPGYLELGTADHVVHILIGLAFVAGAYLTSRKLRNMVPKGTTWH